MDEEILNFTQKTAIIYRWIRIAVMKRFFARTVNVFLFIRCNEHIQLKNKYQVADSADYLKIRAICAKEFF